MLNKKLTLSIGIIFFSLNCYACCGCAIVESAMNSLDKTFQKSLEQYDEISSKTYENNILANINTSMLNLNSNFIALKENTIIESMNSTCIDETSHQIKKSIELKSLSKTQKAIIEFNTK